MADHVVVNDDLERTVDEMLAIIDRQHRHGSALTAICRLYTARRRFRRLTAWLAPTTR